MSYTQVSTFDTIQYYERVVAHEGGLEEAQRFARLFVVPGMGHMQAGPGINDIGQVVSSPEVPQDSEHGIVNALVDWVERGRAPERIVGTSYRNLDPFSGDGSDIRFQRPVYPYPLFPKYVGVDVNSPDSHEPEAHERSVEPASDAIYLDR
ncbi:MAG: tannase/feruloyl esterase family alpha/beta hydrolase [Atopobiaceae bacterium]